MKNILVTDAGSATSNNLIRGLRRAKEDYYIIGTNIDTYSISTSIADKNYKIPRVDSGKDFNLTIRKIIDKEKIDLLIPNSDIEVGALGKNLEQLSVKTLLPSSGAIELCQDKFSLHKFLHKHGHKTAKTYIIKNLNEIEKLFDQLPNNEKLWCRMRIGSGSRGSLPVNKPEQVRFWVKYWNEMRGVPIDYFTLSEFLPGPDYAFQSLWYKGELVCAKTCQRLTYLYGSILPGGTSSTPKIGKLTNSKKVNSTCYKAIKDIDQNATGMFCVDLKEAADGTPYITEINIGRFFTISPAFNNVGKFNMAELFVNLAFGDEVNVPYDQKYSDIGNADNYLVREFDSEPLVLSSEQINNNFLSI